MLFLFMMLLKSSNGQPEEHNVALGAMCCASSELLPHSRCENAVDGVDDEAADPFMNNSEGVGMWLLLQFDDLYLINQISLMDLQITRKNKRATLQFSDGSSQYVTLIHYGSGFIWEDFDLAPVTSYWIYITVTEVFVAGQGGWEEVKVFGVPVEQPPVPVEQPSVPVEQPSVPVEQPSANGCRRFTFKDTAPPPANLNATEYYRQRNCSINCFLNPKCLALSIEVSTGKCRPIFHDCILEKVEADESYIPWVPER